MKKSFQSLINSALIGAIILTGVFSSQHSVSPVRADDEPGQDVCPSSSPWVKIEFSGPEIFEYTFTIPSGYQVAENCYKHATFVHYGTSATVSADEHLECNPSGRCSLKRYALSHASFKLELVASATPTPTPTPTPSATPSASPSASSSASPSASPSADPSADPSVSPSPSADPSVSPSPSPSSTPTPTPTPTATPAPSNNNSSSSSEPQGEVLGAYAGTGVAEDVIMNALGSLGGLMTVAGSVLYGKKKRS